MDLTPLLVHTILIVMSSTLASLQFSQSQPVGTGDLFALLSIRSYISGDPSRALASWDSRGSIHFCQWRGVTCGDDHQSRQRVTELDLDSLNLAGSLSPSIANLTFLQRLHLPNNWLHGHIPFELGFLSHLQHLNLSFNSLGGNIPTSLSRCSQLQNISLGNNMLEGEIPSELGSLGKLRFLSLGYNNLTGGIPDSLEKLQRLQILSLTNNWLSGVIPPWIGNLTSLASLFLKYNNLTGGIPHEIGHLVNLTVLNVGYNKLVGTIPDSLGNLKSLETLSLSYNRLAGAIPPLLWNISSLTVLNMLHNELTGRIPDSVGKLQRLQTLSLTMNQFSGVIPPSIGNISSLIRLYLNDNKLAGTIPDSLQELQKLQDLALSTNNLSGIIPTWIANMSSINILALSENALVGGIPHLLQNLRSISYLDLSYNRLTGTIPTSLWNLSSLTYLSVQTNNLSGALPMNMGDAFPKLQTIFMSFNNFHGPIPYSLSNASVLERFEVDDNEFSGTIPWTLGTLQKLFWLSLAGNRLEAREAIDWRFLTELTNNTQLVTLELGDNQLGGELPKEIANLSKTVERIIMGGNYIFGSIPTDIGNLFNLVSIYLGPNLLTGTLPITLGRLQALNVLDLSQNRFFGEIPSTLGNLTQLSQLHLESNKLGGNIPPNIDSCPLELLNLGNNKLTGHVPKKVLSITSLSSLLDLSHNSLSGPLHSDVGSLTQLETLDISENKMFGMIPERLSECQSLRYLKMEGNLFTGNIPSSFDQLKGLDMLDLSNNNLSGKIPQFLENFKFLINLNLSFNNFDGQVPEGGVFKNSSAVSLIGNDKLCGGNPKVNLPPCSDQTYGRKHKLLRLAMLISAATIALCLILLFFLFYVRNWMRKSRREHFATGFTLDKHRRVSYGELFKATDGFSSANLIGMGSFGSVYKAILNHGDVVAVKVIDLQQRGASKTFKAECQAWINTRHRNLVKILTSCSSIDYKGNEFKALIFEFMPNGSLENWLHPEGNDPSSKKLDLIQRLNIAIDVARALDYLHHHGPLTLIHCDLKPSNILLDDDMTAQVGDFGLARFLSEQVNKQYQRSASSILLKGSIGYIPPEYGVGNDVSAAGDIYSYGILLLEMFTGKRPTADIFKDIGIDNFVETALPLKIRSISDPFLFNNEEDVGDSNRIHEVNGAQCICDCLNVVLKIGIMCSKQSPAERMEVEQIIKELLAIRDAFLCT